MKASDVLNLLHHIPGEVEFEDFAIAVDGKVVKASDALKNILAGKHFAETGEG